MGPILFLYYLNRKMETDDKGNVTIVTTFSPEEFRTQDLPLITARHGTEGDVSKALWDSFSEDYQSALIEICKFAIENSHERIRDWLPYCMKQSDDGLMIHLRHTLAMADVAAAIPNASNTTKLRIKLTKKSIEMDLRPEGIKSEDLEEFVEGCSELLASGGMLMHNEQARLLELAHRYVDLLY